MNSINRVFVLRLGIYVLALVCTVAFASWSIVLSEILLFWSGLVLWHCGESPPYTATVVTATSLTIATGICAKASTQTLWFAHAIDFVGVPLWLLPANVLVSQLVLDVERFVKHNAVVKASLPD